MKQIALIFVVLLLTGCEPHIKSAQELAKCHAKGHCQDEAVTQAEKDYIAEKKAEWDALPEEKKQQYQQPATASGSDNAILYGFLGYMIGSSMADRGSRTTTNYYSVPPSKPSSYEPSRSNSSNYSSNRSSSSGSSYSGSRSSGSSYGSGSRSSGSSYGGRR